ncbi:hypothetical protein HN958_04700 [Candidatus Falkowbacteria bacterium]|jgi:hypothetical protein|nr:hypothetical protein [Candidatus Falkowbacteria bacterium]MBT7007771.1 hypothetical protein [Candidatus Falkowbacteria bacterium]
MPLHVTNGMKKLFEFAHEDIEFARRALKVVEPSDYLNFDELVIQLIKVENQVVVDFAFEIAARIPRTQVSFSKAGSYITDACGAVRDLARFILLTNYSCETINKLKMFSKFMESGRKEIRDLTRKSILKNTNLHEILHINPVPILVELIRKNDKDVRRLVYDLADVVLLFDQIREYKRALLDYAESSNLYVREFVEHYLRKVMQQEELDEFVLRYYSRGRML